MDIQISFAPKPKVIEGATVAFTESAANKVNVLSGRSRRRALCYK
jgi:hypothetical protein